MAIYRANIKILKKAGVKVNDPVTEVSNGQHVLRKLSYHMNSERDSIISSAAQVRDRYGGGRRSWSGPPLSFVNDW
ncbi:hypothetical protein L1987_16006 [Smallanthus sonchifolius]|uniref:Uncharacterized protein n=1 Tax=Smallanthus sonchifolius TaxID=185202 RepID=A0ACB9J8P5_9ASTR|nr:hypothetical protein L1987_16006 [Smallanthus sonchifolius]